MAKIGIAECRTDTIRISTHKTTLPEGFFEKMSGSLTTETTFEATIDNYPIVAFGKHIVYVCFTLYGIEWYEDGYYGCSLLLPEDYLEISIKSPIGYVELGELAYYDYIEVCNRIRQIVSVETLNTKVYDALVDTFNMAERDARGFL